MSWHTTPPVIREDEDENALKLQFAEIWAKQPNDIYSIGYIMFPAPEDVGRAMQAQAWRHDPLVLAAFNRHRDKSEDAEADDKAKFLVKLNSFRTGTSNEKLEFEALKLEAEVLGLTGKGAAVNVNVDASTTRNVLLVPHYETMDAFKEKLKLQQTALLKTARNVKSVN